MIFSVLQDDEAISARALSKSYGKLMALRGFDLTVRHGEIFGFLGPDGAGKTTTIRCLLDLVRPSGGTVRILGVDPQTEHGVIRNHVGYLHSLLDRDEGFTARQLFKHFDVLRGGGMDWAFTLMLADRLELTLDKPINSLTKGNKQKVRLVHAFMYKPEVLLLDEPTQGLDPRMKEVVLNMVREVKEKNGAVLYASNQAREIQYIADRVGVLRAGEVMDVVLPNELAEGWYADVVLWDACDPAKITQIKGVRLVENEDNKCFRLHIVGELDDLFRVLATCRVQRFETERTALPGASNKRRSSCSF
ncbi:MAG: ATP-binding cassette domain-containing protein [Gammaproteobacteria bacterium]|nr:ATP-binding cassette domain-containing protein [Gammaproteobacteria bacterium]